MFFGDNALAVGLDCIRVNKQVKPDFFVSGRTHYSLSYRFSGTTVIEYNGKQIVSGPDTITYVPMNFSYNTIVPEAGDMIVVHFNLIDEEAPCEPMVIKPDDARSIMAQFIKVHENFSAGDRRNPYCLSAFYSIISSLDENGIASLQVSPQAKKIKHLMDKHITESDFGIDVAATALGISDSYLRRVFREAFGVSPWAYIKSKRIETAKSLLLSDYYTISEVATLSGFDSISYFSAEFRRNQGCSPREFINKNKK